MSFQINTTDYGLVGSLTKHASKRIQQRGIPLEIVQLVEEFGQRVCQSGGEQIYLDQGARSNIYKEVGRKKYAQIEKHLNTYLIVCNGVVVTVGHICKRIRKY